MSGGSVYESKNDDNSGSVLAYDFWTPPPLINFLHDHLIFRKIIIVYVVFI